MSTRCVITVRDTDQESDNDTYSIYRHGDGYPDHNGYGVLSDLLRVLPRAWPLPRFEAGDFAAAIVAAWKDEAGGFIYLTRNRDWHGDLAYHYDLTCADGIITVRVEQPTHDANYDITGWSTLSTHHLGKDGYLGELGGMAVKEANKRRRKAA